MTFRIVTFGCRVNSCESAVLSEKAAKESLGDDLIVVNTCAVTKEALRQATQTIRKLRRENPRSRIVVTGCAAQVAPSTFAAMPEVDRVLGNIEKRDFSLFIEESETQVVAGDPTGAVDPYILHSFEDRTRAFLQIQNGCDHACTYCIVPLARGSNVSRPVDEIVNQAETFVRHGYEEIVLTGVDVASHDAFLGVIKAVLDRVPDLKRLRLASLDPAVLSKGFADLFRDKRLMPHVHLSLQSLSDLVLKRMGRRHRFERVKEEVSRLLSIRPELALGADIIAGFPTETEAMHEETLSGISDLNLTLLHVFPYSIRPGTAAAKMPMVPVPDRKRRAEEIRKRGGELYSADLERRIGTVSTVLPEGPLRGFSEYYYEVELESEAVPRHSIRVEITGTKNGRLIGKAI